MSENLYETLREHFVNQLEKPCLQLPNGRQWSYGELDDLSARLAAVLRSRAGPGDRLLMQVGKSPEAVALYLACLRAGLVLVPLNTAYTQSELDYFIGDAEPAIEVYDKTLADLCAEAGRQLPL